MLKGTGILGSAKKILDFKYTVNDASPKTNSYNGMQSDYKNYIQYHCVSIYMAYTCAYCCTYIPYLYSYSYTVHMYVHKAQWGLNCFLITSGLTSVESAWASSQECVVISEYKRRLVLTVETCSDGAVLHKVQLSGLVPDTKEAIPRACSHCHAVIRHA